MTTQESPLNAIAIGGSATVVLRELPGLHTADLRVEPGSSSQAAVADALGFNLPDKTGSVSVKGEALALCLAPDWWLLVGFGEVDQKLAPLREKDDHFSLVNVSGQRTTIELIGPNALEVLAHLWEQDIREKSFPVQTVSQGLMAKAPVIVCHLAPLTYRIMVRSSFALHLWKALVDAAEELI